VESKWYGKLQGLALVRKLHGVVLMRETAGDRAGAGNSVESSWYGKLQGIALVREIAWNLGGRENYKGSRLCGKLRGI
jgi:hypothetical protein